MPHCMRIAAWVIAATLVPGAVGPLLEPELDPAWSREDRQVSASWTPRTFALESTRDSEDAQDTIQVAFDRDDGVLRYTLDADRPDNVSLDYHLRVHGLIEFEDLDGDGRYGLGDPVLKTFPVAEMSPEPVRVESLDGGRKEATASYRLPDHVQSRFQVEVLMTPGRDVGAGALLDPTHVRLTLGVEDFPFEEDRATRLAADVRWDARLDRIDAGVADEQDRFLFRHRWDPAAIVAGTSIPVNTTVQSYTAASGDQTIVAFSYGDPEDLEHTSMVGTDRFSSDLDDRIIRSIVGEWHLYLIGLAAAGLLVGVPLHLRRREG